MNEKHRFDNLVTIRTGVESDLPLIYDSWRKNYDRSTFARKIPSQIYFLQHHHWIEKILSLENVFVTVACSNENHNEIRAWVCYETLDPCLHFIYVRGPFRRMGLASYLLSAVQLPKDAETSHVNDDSKHITRGRNYNPYRFFRHD